VTGAGSKVRKGAPDDFERAHTVSWSDNAHFLQATIAGGTMTVRPIAELVDGRVDDLPRWTPDGTSVKGPIDVRI
jgi:hypothetical protein